MNREAELALVIVGFVLAIASWFSPIPFVLSIAAVVLNGWLAVRIGRRVFGSKP